MTDRSTSNSWYWSIAGVINYGIFWLYERFSFLQVEFPAMGGRGPVGVPLPIVISLVGGVVILLGSLLHARLRDYGLGALIGVLPWVTLWWLLIHAG